ncbi:MAG: alcohol dehydrogenase catalytic domain-containing protein [Streptosporangiales bacterium]|nr:alcohol dehydrogenase catalytic domain-containing protein [Streptosporangiales bacterium]
MKAIRWYGEGDVRFEEAPEPTIAHPDDAILRVTTAAICGSDLHLYHGKIPKVRPGTIVGHEFVGVVEEVGPGVRRIDTGQRCVASMMTACGRCAPCIAGNHAGCPQFGLFGYGRMFGELEGGQAEYVRVPMADMTLYPVPEGMADEQMLFVGDILATAYSGCHAASIGHGDSVVVVGAGPVGLLTVECAYLFGPAEVYVVDLVAARLQRAAELGGIPINASEHDPLEQLRSMNRGERASVVIEAVGNSSALATAWRLAETGGRIALVGVLVDEPFPESAGRTWLRSLSVTSVTGQTIRYRDTLTQLIQAGRLQPERIISERIGLDEVPAAYRRIDRRETIKVVINP